MGAAAVAAGCTGPRLGFGTGGSMFGFAAKPMRRVRVGVVGLGCRGRQAIPRLAAIPGVEVAVEQVDRVLAAYPDRVHNLVYDIRLPGRGGFGVATPLRVDVFFL